MGTATMPPPSDKKKAGSTPAEKPKRTTKPIQVDADLAEMAVVIAAHDGKNISEIVSPLIRQWIVTNYERVNREIAARIQKMKEDKRE